MINNKDIDLGKYFNSKNHMDLVAQEDSKDLIDTDNENSKQDYTEKAKDIDAKIVEEPENTKAHKSYKRQQIPSVPFEQAMTELEEIVRLLSSNSPTLSLDLMLEKVKRATYLKKICQKRLNDAKLEIQEITEKIE